MIMVTIFVCAVRDNTRIQPQSTKAYIGSTTGFSCISQSPVTWRFNKGNLLKNVKFVTTKHWQRTEQRLIIDNVQIYNSGTYECLGEDIDFLAFIAEGNLEVLGK